MRIIIYLVTCIAALAASSLAGAESDSARSAWNTSLVTDLTLTQISYSDSWVGGEAGSVNWVWNLDGSAERPLSPKVNFKSTLRLKFGQTLTQELVHDSGGAVIDKAWSKPRKSTDLIDWENVARFTLGGPVDPYAAFRVETQFFDGQAEQKKLYFSPLKFTESVGLARQFLKKDNQSVISRLGLALRQTVKTAIVDSLLNTESSTVTDGGLESVTDATLQLSEKVQYVGKLTLYQALSSSESDNAALAGTAAEDYWKALDANFENTITASVSKVITVSLYAQILYDQEVDKAARLKETLALGFVYRML